MPGISRTGASTVPYLSLEPALERRMKADKRAGALNPWRCRDAAAVRREDNPHDAATLVRPPFVRDVEKILNVPAYNRYADKTQVFSFAENDDLCRRGLHVQLVSRIARTIGSALGLNADLIEAISLGHDIGHTPFGHAGEKYLDSCLAQRTGRRFNHNVHSVRVLDRLYPRNLCLQTLDGILCHNGEFVQQTLALGAMESFEDLDRAVEACAVDQGAIATLRPSTLEGCVVRASDMIAYVGKDRQDALDFGLIGSLDEFDADYIGVGNAQIINNLTIDIIEHSYGKDRIGMSRAAFDDLKRAKRQNYEKIYETEGVMTGAGNLVESMFARLYEKLVSDAERFDEDSPIFRHHVSHLAAKSRSFDLERYRAEGSDQMAVDYIASMTDGYFMSLYRFLFPGDDVQIAIRGYCADLAEAREQKGLS